ncbi:MAG: DEAD/DEAH box helicase [Chlamydiae bacterium]|nr:DEAD/DEAH box helicase [Chlamydiota bacterium]
MTDKIETSFQDLNLHPKILKAITDAGYTIPTPIQQAAIPEILKGSDLCGAANTGTGKTAAFMLPILHRLISNPSSGQGPRVLVLVPTRELAMQVSNEAIKYSKHLHGLKTVCIYGGVPYPKQKRDLSNPYDILVATPGRLIDYMERGQIRFSRLELLVLDEADRMLDMGFIDPVKKIAAATPKSRQTLLFSATLKENVVQLSKHLLNNPVKIGITLEQTKHENIDQRVLFVDNVSHKHRILDHILKDPELSKAIVFTATKFFANQLVDKLKEDGHFAAVLHGDIKQQKRTKTISLFKAGKVKILIATDVAARGVDIQNVSHVINFDLPRDVEDHVHRIGRTGRAGSTGIALSFAAPKDIPVLRRIEKFTNQKMTVITIPGMEPSLKASTPTHERPHNNNKRSFRPKRFDNKNRFHHAKKPGKKKFFD